MQKALKSSDECEKPPFSLGRGWLLHKLVVFPFLLFVFYGQDRETGLLLHLLLSPFILSYCGELGKKLVTH